MSSFSSRPYMNYLRFVMVGVLGLAAISIVAMTYRWPLVWDAQVFHYINFLIGKGLAPYRDIGDMNLPECLPGQKAGRCIFWRRGHGLANV